MPAAVLIMGGNNVMKTDLYTKAILTVIAMCLIWMCVNGATPVIAPLILRGGRIA